ncbi:MAG: translation initiation factor IF-2, partial [Leptospiraceae bacterium]|nr:translation initiation factor IF-2 [Leptospiraceae bacterium]
FLDTPGHEAFSAMRARGAAVTDIIILVVAADDGVKPQTREAISHAREAKVPVIVAVNKIDLPAADVQRVKMELASEGIQSEDYGGDVVFCEISAKQNIGIENLLEMILLQAEVLDLRANPGLRANGHVIEARVDAGKGPVATILIEKGTLREGDPYVVGTFSGRIRAMFDDYGNRIQEAEPSFPVEITGIEGVPSAGDPFQVVESDRYGREVASKRQHYKQITEAASRAQPGSGDLSSWVQDHKELKIIIKADVQGSVEAIRDGLLKLETDDVKLRIIHAATGAISDSDVNLAAASEALIIAFHVRAASRASDLADQNNVQIKTYNIIYDIINDITLAMEGLLEPERIEESAGEAEVREIFKISKIGNIAGCMVLSGKIKRGNPIRVKRDGVVLYDGSVKAIKRHKDDVAEVAEGFECGISIDGFNDIQSGDILESYSFREIARTLK